MLYETPTARVTTHTHNNIMSSYYLYYKLVILLYIVDCFCEKIFTKYVTLSAKFDSAIIVPQ